MKLGPGVLFGSINKMLEQGLIEESDERPDAHLDDQRRRYYRITPYGRKVAQAEAGANARTGPFGRRKIRGPAPCLMPGYRSSCIAVASVLYPVGFRENYAGSMERQFLDVRRRNRAGGSRWRRCGFVYCGTAIPYPPKFARDIRQDGRHALRLWSRRPLHTGFAISALAIGIGANTGVFSVVNALLLRSLPFRDPDRLIATHSFLPSNQSEKQFHDWAKQSTYLEDAAITYNGDVNLGGTRESARAHLTETSWNFFTLLGAQPSAHILWIGRGFAPQEDTPGKSGVAVISYGLWQQLFAGNAAALGSTIRANGTPLTIIGVAAPDFDYPARTALWTPTAFSRELYSQERLSAGISRAPETRRYLGASHGSVYRRCRPF